MQLKVRIKFPIKYNKNKIVIVMFHHSLMNADIAVGHHLECGAALPMVLPCVSHLQYWSLVG